MSQQCYGNGVCHTPLIVLCWSIVGLCLWADSDHNVSGCGLHSAGESCCVLLLVIFVVAVA